MLFVLGCDVAQLVELLPPVPLELFCCELLLPQEEFCVWELLLLSCVAVPPGFQVEVLLLPPPHEVSDCEFPLKLVPQVDELLSPLSWVLELELVAAGCSSAH